MAPATAAPTAAAAAPLKVAFVLPSPIGQAGWSYQHNQGRLAMEAALAGQVKTTVVENVAEGADSERVFRDLAAQGHRLIIAASLGYLEPALRVAAEFPNVRFEHAGGHKTAANLNTYNARNYEARYLAGLLAGKTSASGNAGYVAAHPVPEVVQGINAFALGMRAANPKAQVRVLWTNAWFDPAREREAAQSLVNQGVDVLTNHSGSTAVAQVAQENFKAKGVKLIAYQSDMSAFAPDAQLAAVTQHWGSHYTNVAQSLLLKQWSNTPVWAGLKEDMVQLSALQQRLPPELRVLLDTRRKAIVGGSLKPFAAPLIDNEGKSRLASGALDDAAVARMNWFVQGVVGSVPRP
ncbi:MAG: membrane protein [Methylibium sp. NZG]|nr:MAG: membrane protein [Methylibium sp. NZG]